MTKRRDPLSLEDAVFLAHACLGDSGVEEITGKSARLVRMWSDPDDDGHKIPLIQALRLDRALVVRGEHPSILTAYKAELRRAHAAATVPGDPMARLVDAMAEMGDLAEELRRARCPNGEGGRQITPEEAREILRALGDLRGELLALETDVVAGLPTLRPVEVAS
ncbi:hypothetical protein VY88_27070 [Azospirillum thiophilum]|uniref:Uncharacterized protein n=1 Tax=Azospirillum thiophilum TaxID=528244 RepID=A0AAC8W4Z8_9PROT|nr:phage regulatory CII family protein [Azospirillum thiophilum]ALG75168.1 hypothetical protein AL072_29980 [Azospirillum thiophilum]KJR62560.1 hypothetical protein VY88_27070 [Azospirillum thiophilum]